LHIFINFIVISLSSVVNIQLHSSFSSNMVHRQTNRKSSHNSNSNGLIQVTFKPNCTGPRVITRSVNSSTRRGKNFSSSLRNHSDDIQLPPTTPRNTTQFLMETHANDDSCSSSSRDLLAACCAHDLFADSPLDTFGSNFSLFATCAR